MEKQALQRGARGRGQELRGGAGGHRGRVHYDKGRGLELEGAAFRGVGRGLSGMRLWNECPEAHGLGADLGVMVLRDGGR